MYRPELHRRRRPDVLSRPPERPRLDSIAWNAAHPPDERLAAAVADLRARLAESDSAAKTSGKDGRAA